MREFAEAEWDRARRALRSARQLAQSDPDSAVSRAYYSVFHALTAIFALRGRTFSRHSAIRAALHRELVHSGLLVVELGRDYDFLMDLREAGDYGGVEEVSVADAELAVQKAEMLITAIEPLFLSQRS